MIKDLRIIENNMVPVYETDAGEKVVFGTELHKTLEVKSKFADWVKNRLNDCDADTGMDYDTCSKILEQGHRPTLEYIIKLDTAKEMAMLERNEKGKQVRRYFIEVEKKHRQTKTALSELDLFELSLNAIKENRSRIEAVNKDLQAFKQEMPLLGVEESRITCAARKKGVDCLGGKESAAYRDKSIRSRLYADIYRQLKREFGVTSYKAIRRSQCDHAVGIIENYKMPYVLMERVEQLNGQMVIE